LESVGAEDGLRFVRRELAQKVARERCNVAASIPKRGDAQHDDLQTVVEILAEAGLAYERGKIAMRRCEDLRASETGATPRVPASTSSPALPSSAAGDGVELRAGLSVRRILDPPRPALGPVLKRPKAGAAVSGAH
jgi:hypothetical protein